MMASFRIRDILSCQEAAAAFCAEDTDLKKDKLPIQTQTKMDISYHNEKFEFVLASEVRNPLNFDSKHSLVSPISTPKEPASPQKSVEISPVHNHVENFLARNKVSNDLIKKDTTVSLNKTTGASGDQTSGDSAAPMGLSTTEQQLFKFHSLIPNLFINNNDVTAQQSQQNKSLLLQQQTGHVILKESLVNRNQSLTQNLSGSEVFLRTTPTNKCSPNPASVVEIPSPGVAGTVVLPSQGVTLSSQPPNSAQFFSSAANCATLNNICEFIQLFLK